MKNKKKKSKWDFSNEKPIIIEQLFTDKPPCDEYPPDSYILSEKGYKPITGKIFPQQTFQDTLDEHATLKKSNKKKTE